MGSENEGTQVTTTYSLIMRASQCDEGHTGKQVSQKGNGVTTERSTGLLCDPRERDFTQLCGPGADNQGS